MATSHTRAEQAPAGARILAVTGDYTFGAYDGVFVVAWRGQPTSAAFEARDELLRAYARDHAGDCALVEIIESSSNPPPPDIRPQGIAIFAELKGSLDCIAFLMDSPSLRTTLNRAVLTGMSFLLPQPIPTKAFKTADAMSDWLREQLGRETPGLLGAVNFFRGSVA